MTVLDVGHGLAIVIEKNQQVLLYDTGAKYPSGFDMGTAAVTPYLKYQGYQQIDKVIISHNDNDHAGGLASILTSFTVKDVMANEINALSTERCVVGNDFHWQGLRFEVLSPTTAVGDNNDDSCVIRLTDGQHSVLLTGDISKRVERKLAAQFAQHKLASDILIAPHHGSKSSSSALFLQQVAAQYAVFSSGFMNRWQMPSDAIQQRYQQQNINMLNTAELGMIRFTFNKQDIKVANYRQQLRPFWFTTNLKE